MFSPHWIRLLLVILLGICAGRPAHGSEQMVKDVNATASMYDPRTSLDEDENKGCYNTGCLPRYTVDGLLNDEGESRWSCSEETDATIGECYIVFDLHESYTLSKLRIYFHKSNVEDRETNSFSVSTSADNDTYSYSFGGSNTAGTPLLQGENFSFPDGPSGRYVRLTAILDSDQWLSINEVETFVTVDVGSPSPTPVGVTSGLTSTASESVAPTASSSLTYSFMPTTVPTTVGTPIGGLECPNVTVSNTEGLDGVYVWYSGTSYLSTGTNNATIESSELTIDCADTSTTGCSVTEWTITSEEDTSLMYMAYDDAEYPAWITEVWLRENCTSRTCVTSPVNVEIVCGDGSTSGAPSSTPTPAPVTSTDCDIVEVEGTSGGDLDGFYYDDGSTKQGGVTQFLGYDDDLTSNGNTLAAEWVAGGCPSPSGNTTGTNGDCTWRQWSITPDSDNFDAFQHFTYDEADHPVDIASGILWFETIEAPYAGDITITCAPADTPTLLTPSPTPVPTNISIPTTVVSSIPPATPITVASGGDSDGAPDNTPAIIGGVAGAAVVLALLGFLAYKRLNTPPPQAPPSYDDIVGVAGSGSMLKPTAGKEF